MDIRSKAVEIEMDGALARGEFNPTGKPKAIYNYWREHSIKEPPANENFCHFWRVVAIWAPLAWLRVKISSLAEKSATWYATAAVYVALAVLLGIFVHVAWPIAMLGIPYALTNLATLAMVNGEGWEDVSKNKAERYFLLANPVGLGIALLVCLIKKKYKYASDKTRDTIGIIISVGGIVLFAALILFCLANIFIEFGFLASLGIIFAAIALVALFIAFVYGLNCLFELLGEYLTNKRRDDEDEAAAQREYRRENGIPEPEYQPGIFRRFLTGAGDFFLLVWNIARVNKWKICPIVRID